MGIRRFIALPTLAVGLCWHAAPAAAAVLTFETPGEYDANFREIHAGPETSQTNNGAANDFVVKTQDPSTNTATVAVFDTTPADDVVKSQFASPVTVTFDARVANASSSVGIYIVNPANDDQGLLALFNVDDSGAGGQDRIRFWTGANPDTSGAGSTVDTLSGNAGVTAGSGAFFPMSLTYSVSGSTPTMTLSAGSLSRTFTFAADTAIDNPEIALRLFDTSAAGTVDVDNFDIVPEPSGAAVVGLCAAFGVLARRRRNRDVVS